MINPTVLTLAALLGVSAGISVGVSVANADAPLDVPTYLRAFHENPKAMMKERLVKLDENGNPIPFTPATDFNQRVRSRADLITRGSGGVSQRSEIPDSENPGPLLSGLRIEVRLDQMERRDWREKRLPLAPWSGSYWPTQKGGLGWRYNDEAFPAKTFAENHAYYEANPSEWQAPEVLSPSEKYDRLLGDTEYSYTKANWQKGLDVVTSKPDVPTWYGICHGWAPAAYIEDEPRRAVTVAGASGEMLTFYPADIKALAASLWADTDPDVVFLGKKCTKEKPVEDEYGRVIDPECFNTNPGTWHLAIVNRIASGQESVVMDATFDVEVWNQPVLGYKYNYFNPQSFEVSEQLDQAILPIEKFTIDKFKKYRSAKTKFVVGVAFDVTYVIENDPVARDGRDRVRSATVRYLYDLELNDAKEIIGGEWYSDKHPDFIWGTAAGFSAISFGERKLRTDQPWHGDGPIPSQLIDAAKISSPRSEPLAAIVRGLIEKSK